MQHVGEVYIAAPNHGHRGFTLVESKTRGIPEQIEQMQQRAYLLFNRVGEDHSIVSVEANPHAGTSSWQRREDAQIYSSVEETVEGVDGDDEQQWREWIALPQALQVANGLPCITIQQTGGCRRGEEKGDPVSPSCREAQTLQQF
jgi:hypothetical protein